MGAGEATSVGPPASEFESEIVGTVGRTFRFQGLVTVPSGPEAVAVAASRAAASMLSELRRNLKCGVALTTTLAG